MIKIKDAFLGLGKTQVISSGRKLLVSTAITLIAFTLILLMYQFDWTGFGDDLTKTVSTEKALQDGKFIVTKETTYEQSQSGKALWDWLELSGTLAIPVVLYQFQRDEQERSEQQAQAEKELAANDLREEALQIYVDRISELLLDKRLKTLPNDDPLRDTALDVARARTLSVLRRLDQDGERKGSVIRFLIDTELISNLKLDLNSADLSGADLRDVNLKSANLSGANFSGANLSGANLSDANLSDANLSDANLSDANLFGANLFGSNLNSSNLFGANLFCADLSDANLTDANLTDANLNSANLFGANLSNVNLTRASLTRADLNDANLTRADFCGTILFSADISGATISGAKNLSSARVKTAKNWEKARYNPEVCQELDLPEVQTSSEDNV